jgi:hypothetical protein
MASESSIIKIAVPFRSKSEGLTKAFYKLVNSSPLYAIVVINHQEVQLTIKKVAQQTDDALVSQQSLT